MKSKIIGKINNIFAQTLKKGGFTLIETLVAISILTIAVTGPLSLASKGISYSSYAKDEITAFYLANEAIDVIRNIRDTNINSGAADWLQLKTGINLATKCAGTNGCYFDVWRNPVDLRDAFYPADSVLKTCVTEDVLAKKYLLRFGYEFIWANTGPTDCIGSAVKEQSSFSRQVRIESVGLGNNEIRVTVTVLWTAKGGIDRKVIITENLFKLGSIQ